jgi:aryl-alcohol dehydrogenase-like predicted oxidoreductase
MHYRRLGTTEAEVSEIGFGAWGIGGNQWQGGRDEESMKALRRAFDLGVNLVDTALAYGDGHSEQLVGQAIRKTFHKVWVATKIPPKNKTWPASSNTPIAEVFPYQYIIDCTEQSLRNLNVEQIYLQQFHVWTDAWTQTDEWKRAVEQLRASGKVRYFGISVSEHEPDSANEALQTGYFTAVQVIYNIFDQKAEANLFPLCQKLKLGVLARVPLDEGGLTGAITEDTKFEPGEFRESYFRGERKRELVQRLDAIRRDLADLDIPGTVAPGTLPEIALRFCLSHPAVTSVIPGMRRVSSVESSSKASTSGKLNARTLQILRRHTWDRNFYL